MRPGLLPVPTYASIPATVEDQPWRFYTPTRSRQILVALNEAKLLAVKERTRHVLDINGMGVRRPSCYGSLGGAVESRTTRWETSARRSSTVEPLTLFSRVSAASAP